MKKPYAASYPAAKACLDRIKKDLDRTKKEETVDARRVLDALGFFYKEHTPLVSPDKYNLHVNAVLSAPFRQTLAACLTEISKTDGPTVALQAAEDFAALALEESQLRKRLTRIVGNYQLALAS